MEWTLLIGRQLCLYMFFVKVNQNCLLWSTVLAVLRQATKQTGNPPSSLHFYLTNSQSQSFFKGPVNLGRGWQVWNWFCLVKSFLLLLIMIRGAKSRTWARGQFKHGWAPSRAQIWCDGPPQIGWSPGFVKSKKDGENAGCCLVPNMMWSQKKRSSPKFRLFFRRKSSDLKKKNLPLRFRWPFYYSMQFEWAPSRAHGFPKHHGFRGQCPPCPPSRRPWLWSVA